MTTATEKRVGGEETEGEEMSTTIITVTRPATLSEHISILLARHFETLSPAERKELETTSKRLDALEAENERLERARADAISIADAAQAEIERLRADLADHRVMHGDTVMQLQHKIADLGAELATARNLHMDLLFQVQNKWPGETRHETAKRYIREREQHTNGPAQSALKREGGGNG